MAPSRWGFPVPQAMQRHTGSRVTPSPPLQPALPAASTPAGEPDQAQSAAKEDKPAEAKPLTHHKLG